MAHDVFISYAHQDQAIADLVCAGAEARGLRCWMAPRDIAAGADWGGAIIKAIRASKVMVLVFSSGTNQSRHVPRELERAIDLSIPVIPFRIEDVKPGGALEYGLSSVHWFDAVTPPMEGHIARLAETLGGMLGTAKPPIVLTPVPAPSAATSPRASAAPQRFRPSLLVVGIALVALALVAGYFYFSIGRPTPRDQAVSSTTSTVAATTTSVPPATTSGMPVVQSPTPEQAAPAAATTPPSNHTASKAEPPATGRATKDPATAKKCQDLLQSASVGQELTADQKAFLQHCK